MPASDHIVSVNKMVLDYDGLFALLDAPPPRVIDDWAEFVLPHNAEQCGPKFIGGLHPDTHDARLAFCVTVDQYGDVLDDIERKPSDPLPEPAPGDYCEDAREVALDVWEWRGRRYFRDFYAFIKSMRECNESNHELERKESK